MNTPDITKHMSHKTTAFALGSYFTSLTPSTTHKDFVNNGLSVKKFLPIDTERTVFAAPKQEFNITFGKKGTLSGKQQPKSKMWYGDMAFSTPLGSDFDKAYEAFTDNAPDGILRYAKGIKFGVLITKNNITGDTLTWHRMSVAKKNGSGCENRMVLALVNQEFVADMSMERVEAALENVTCYKVTCGLVLKEEYLRVVEDKPVSKPSYLKGGKLIK